MSGSEKRRRYEGKRVNSHGFGERARARGDLPGTFPRSRFKRSVRRFFSPSTDRRARFSARANFDALSTRELSITVMYNALMICNDAVVKEMIISAVCMCVFSLDKV